MHVENTEMREIKKNNLFTLFKEKDGKTINLIYLKLAFIDSYNIFIFITFRYIIT